MKRMLCIAFALFALSANAANAKNTPSSEEQLLKAIADGDLELVTELAVTIDLDEIPNLPYHALGSPSADVVEFLRAKGDFSISDLQIASIRGDAMEIRRLLAKLDKKSRAVALAEWYAPPMCSCSPLSLAVRRGHKNSVRELVALGANVNESTHYTLTPLANAAELGHLEIVKLLLQAGAEVNATPDGYTPLMRACIGGQPETAGLLLEAGAELNLKRSDGQRALHFAAKRGNAECVNLLLQGGADINAVAYEKDTALEYAELYKHKDVVKLLLQATKRD